jgi:hypothetical protein
LKAWLSWWSWHIWGREVHLGLDRNEEPMLGNDMDDQPRPIVKYYEAREYKNLSSNFAMENSSKFSVVDIMNMQSFMNKLNNM